MSLLDFLNTDEGRLGLGLLAAGGPTAQPMGFGERIQMAMRGQDEYKQNQTRNKHQQLQYDQGLLSFEKAKRDSLMEQQFSDAAKSAYLSPEAARAQNGLNMGPQLDGSALPHAQPGFDQSKFLTKAWGIDPMKAMELEQKLAKDNSPLTVAPGASLVDRRTMKPIYTAPDKTAPTEIEKLYTGMQNYPEGHPMRKVFADAIKKASTHSPGTTVNVSDGLGLKPKDRFEMEGKLSDDFAKATDMDRKVLRSVSKISTALSLDGALKDQAAIYDFAKALDPDGAVREADYAAIAGSAGLVDRVRNSANRLLTGERLTPTQRTEMLQLGEAWAKVANARIGPQRARFAAQAQRYNLNPEAVLDPEKASTGWSIKPIPGK